MNRPQSLPKPFDPILEFGSVIALCRMALAQGGGPHSGADHRAQQGRPFVDQLRQRMGFAGRFVRRFRRQCPRDSQTDHHLPGRNKVAGYSHTRQKSPIRLRASQRQKHSETHDFGWLHGSAHVVTLVERPQERPADTTPRRQQMTTMDERAMATDVDVSIRPRKEWALLYKQKQLAKA
jgi:hypothetical protein